MTATLPHPFLICVSQWDVTHNILHASSIPYVYIHQYNNTTMKIVNCNANIYFNQECIKNSLIPQYGKLQIPHTSLLVNIQ